MPTDDRLLLRPVRLVVVTPWDAGFQLSPRTEPLPDVPPGSDYVTDCLPTQSVLIQEVLVRDFALVHVSTRAQTVKVAPVERGSLPRLYRLPTPVTAHPDECVSLRLRNDGPATLKQKMCAVVRVDAAAVRIDPAPAGRAEDDVPCPACGKEPGDSCDGPASHPSRRTLHVERAAARADQASIVDANWLDGTRGPTSRCPTCDALVRADRRELVGTPLRVLCKDSWHDGPIVHVPWIERHGDTTMIRGCACGADVPTAATFGHHVGLPDEAVRTILGLVSVAYDLMDKVDARHRIGAKKQIAHCLEFVR